MRTILQVSLLALLLASCATARPEFIQGPAGRIRVDDGGRGGLPIVFVHGNGGDRSQWSAQLAHLRASRRAVAYDLRGMGESDPSASGDYSVGAMAADLDAVTRALGIRRFVLAGHSYGGAVAAAYAAAHPERVAGIAFVDAAGSVTMTDEVAARVEKALTTDKPRVARAWFAPILAPSSAAVREAVFASVDRTPAGPFTGALLSLRQFGLAVSLERYKGPCVALAAVAIEQPASFHKQFAARCAIEPVADAGHWLMLDRPAEVNRILDAFLGSLR